MLVRHLRSGYPVTIVTPGKYLLSASQPTSPAPADVAVGRSLGGGIGVTVLLILLGVVVFIPAGLLVVVITAVRRNLARRRLSRAGELPQAGAQA